ncbi:MAG TPA: 3-methyl-2-oxobutanoate hydroxymethyltransferase [Miltoncostaeaceae bacterium]|nr:3-methyl-2-oxobutanoate hydroxymethyltransferase [Miltoncostaeaceae bacterium]
MYGSGAHADRPPSTGLSPAALHALKGRRRLAMLTAYDYPTALALDACGLDMLLVGDSLGEVELGYTSTREVTLAMMVHHVRAVRHGVTRTHLVGDMPADTYRTPEEAVETARALVAAGADSVKLEGALLPQVRAILADGIAVMGHVGLLPQTHTERRRRGRTPEEAAAILDDARALDRLGCYAIVIEAVDAEVAAEVTAQVAAPTIGIAAGLGTDGQVLVSTDLLGQLPEPPRFVTPRADVHGLVMRVGREFAEEVRAAAPVARAAA